MLTQTGQVTVEHTVLATRLGDLTVVRDHNQLTGLYFRHHWYMPDPATFGQRSDRGFEDVSGQLEEYLAGSRTLFELPLGPRGTEFQLRVWQLIAQVPYGLTTSYGDVARRLGCDVTAQQVGAAVGRNPLSILIPCHRVIGNTGKLTGYAGGLTRKRDLLELEQATMMRVPQGGQRSGSQGPGRRSPARNAAAARLDTHMHQASTASSRISAWSRAASQARTQL